MVLENKLILPNNPKKIQSDVKIKIQCALCGIQQKTG